MHYIEYIPGTVARITDKPTAHGHKDVNLLSRWVCKVNQLLVLNPRLSVQGKLDLFCDKLKPFQLP